MKSLMYQAACALSALLDRDDIDARKVAVIICADDRDTRIRVELALARDMHPLMLTGGPAVPTAPNVRAFKLHGIRVVVSDLSHEEPMYLITKDAPR